MAGATIWAVAGHGAALVPPSQLPSTFASSPCLSRQPGGRPGFLSPLLPEADQSSRLICLTSGQLSTPSPLPWLQPHLPLVERAPNTAPNSSPLHAGPSHRPPYIRGESRRVNHSTTSTPPGLKSLQSFACVSPPLFWAHRTLWSLERTRLVSPSGLYEF